MSKADKMFEEIGYKIKRNDDKFIIYNCYGIQIRFDLRRRSVISSNTLICDHLAIHEKMKELGWL